MSPTRAAAGILRATVRVSCWGWLLLLLLFPILFSFARSFIPFYLARSSPNRRRPPLGLTDVHGSAKKRRATVSCVRRFSEGRGSRSRARSDRGTIRIPRTAVKLLLVCLENKGNEIYITSSVLRSHLQKYGSELLGWWESNAGLSIAARIRGFRMSRGRSFGKWDRGNTRVSLGSINTYVQESFCSRCSLVLRDLMRINETLTFAAILIFMYRAQCVGKFL